MIKIQYVSDLPIKRLCKCDACGKSLEHDAKGVHVEFVSNDIYLKQILLCSKCRTELYERI